MYDFCFSPIYAVLLAIGGVAGYITKGSMASLGAGLGSAALLGLMSKWSLDSYHKGKACKPATAISLLVAAGLTYVMYERYSATGKLLLAGLTAGLSAAMTGGRRDVHHAHTWESFSTLLGIRKCNMCVSYLHVKPAVCCGRSAIPTQCFQRVQRSLM
jgi:uncharacterized membrane protein (UPF0136 family)